MSSTSASLCNPTSVPTTLPSIDMTTNWCVVPSTNNNTSQSTSPSNSTSTSAISNTIMQQCCDSATVHDIGGCEWCYYQDDTAKNSGQFNEDFAACLRREAGVRGVQAVGTHYCNTPKLSGAVSVDSKGWKTSYFVVLVGVSVALQQFI
jgi:hypothetical protein